MQPGGELSEFARNALNDLIQQGLCFTVASARSCATIREVIAGLRLRLPVVEFNGALVTDLVSGRHVLVQSMDRAVAPEILERVGRLGCMPIVSTVGGGEDHCFYDYARNVGMRHYIDGRVAVGDRRMRQVACLVDALLEEVVCMTLVGRREELLVVLADIEECFPEVTSLHLFENKYLPGWFWLTIQDRGASKARALRVLMEMHGFDEGAVTVFGDDNNDVPMFQMAGRALAVDNATDVLKAHADAVIGPNSADSVVRYILEHGGGWL